MSPELLAEYGFLLADRIDPPTLARAAGLAPGWEVSVHVALIRLGWLTEADYVAALARRLGLAQLAGRRVALASGSATALDAVSLDVAEDGRPRLAIRAIALPPAALAAAIRQSRLPSDQLLLATSAELEALQVKPLEREMLHHAVLGLDGRDPSLSARLLVRTGQVAWAAAVAGLLAALLVLFPDEAPAGIAAAITLPFLCNSLLRLAGLVELMRARPAAMAPTPRIADAELPVYTILVPLHDEVEVLPRLVASLAALDYPPAKLDIVLVLEESDQRTQNAARRLDLPGNVRIVLVPRGGPQTKPKALNFALDLIRGEFVVVYDAEDRPEPAQLREALAAFAAAGPDLACVQARLNIYNTDKGFLTRQFTIEYTALFDALLPALARLGLPLPLGGTSNHFRASVLRQVGAWDPFNVTEDADLGIRLVRLGYRTTTIASTTWEEAPDTFGNWFRQRTRWLKGWLQTYCVITRRPIRLAREVGAWSFVGLHVLMGGILLSALTHPVVYAVIGWGLWTGELLAIPEDGLALGLWALAIVNLLLGGISTIALAALAVARRGWLRLVPRTVLMPAYWVLITVAGYWALIELIRKPHYWAKTKHGGT